MDCDCRDECDRWGVCEDGSGGFFCPYDPFSRLACKRHLGRGDIGPHIIRRKREAPDLPQISGPSI